MATEVLDTSRREGLRSSAARAFHVLSVLAERAGDTDAAIANEAEAVTLVEAGAAPVDGVLSVHHLGRLLLAGGQDAEGTRLLRDAAAQVRRRLQDLRDAELRDGYERQAAVRRILADDPA
jgi:sirohydrochlorin ferrochelatase